MSAATNRDALRLIEANTELQTPPLCPEIRLRLLKPQAPLLEAWGECLFDDAGPRPYWAYCWASGQAVARYLLDQPHLVRDRRVLDLGSGSGIAAIAAARAGAATVRATDVDPVALAAIDCNARSNRATVITRHEDTIAADDRDWDVLLACDVCYRWSNHDWLCRLDEAQRLILIGDPGRPGLAIERLEELARYAVRTVPELEHPDLKQAAVYRVRPRGIRPGGDYITAK